jgi:hypothetical protein
LRGASKRFTATFAFGVLLDPGDKRRDDSLRPPLRAKPNYSRRS